MEQNYVTVTLCLQNKEEKYANIGSQYLFAPIAAETLGTFEHVSMPTLW